MKEGALVPADEAELAAMIRAAAGPLAIAGGGTRMIGRPVEGERLSTAGLAGILRYEPEALTLVVRAGTPLAEVGAALAAQRQRLPFEPPDWSGLTGAQGISTMGGIVAANASGPRRVQAGAARDSLIGVRFVDGRGAIVSNGGRTMKNVTGYDLVKLMAGSRGTLGVLSEVSFKLLPAAGDSATLTVEAGDAVAGVAVMTAALTSPFDVTGAAWLPGRGAVIRIEGLAQSVAYRAGALADRLGRQGAVAVERDPAANAALWRDVGAVTPLTAGPGDIWRIAARPSEAAGLAARAPGDVMLDWGGGLIWARVAEGIDLRAALGPFAGHATLVRAAPATRARIAPIPPEAPAVAALAQGLRARFDPRGILNPGLMG
jgi:glycolate oxidase FAD binding subunit